MTPEAAAKFKLFEVSSQVTKAAPRTLVEWKNIGEGFCVCMRGWFSLT